ncbi:MAG: ferrous iron transport protein B, partial [Planctomycetes bacterium]|nr:ferrous iron transport protein B [Planctomycetota bacterium]
ADRRYGFISGACQESVRSSVELRHTRSDRVDAVVTHGALGLVIFLALMYGVFYLTFTVGQPLMELIEALFGHLADLVAGFWPDGADSPLKSLLIDGVIGGVGGVLVFLPNIVLLFAAIAFLEDSGYMARGAFIMDRLMHKIGLHGKSFIPMLIGFGCTVPAIMATRVLESRRDRLVTMLVLPLISCGARLPIYSLIIPAFFAPRLRAPMLLVIYVIGIVLAIVGVKLLRTLVFKGESEPFVMELPPYRMPTVKGVFIHTWERASAYLKKAGTIILAFSVLMWALATYPRKTHLERDYDAELVRVDAARDASLVDLNSALGLPPDSPLLLQDDLGETAAVPPQVVRFVHLRQTVEAARRRFDDAVADEAAEAGSPRYIALQTHHFGELHRLQQAAPEVYPLVARYLDEVDRPHEEQVRRIQAARAAELLAASLVGRLGRLLEPMLKPLGFDWKIGTALIGAVAGKELFVAQMGIVYAVGEADSSSEALRAQLRRNYSPLTGFCIMLFCLVSMPCVATFAVTARESGRLRWAVLQAASLTVMAYALTLAAYQIGTLLGLGTTSVG